MVLANKTDLISEDAKINLLNTLNNDGFSNTLSIQANKASENEIMVLKTALHAAIKNGAISEGQTILTNLRHYIALNDAREALHVVVDGLNNRLTSDMLALDIKRALNALGEVTGEISSQEILINIFGKFCIGK
jgi:tRNA modification GTPase